MSGLSNRRAVAETAPRIASLGLSFPSEPDAAFQAFEEIHPSGKEQLQEIESRAAQAIKGKGRCWWNPDKDETDQRLKFGLRIVD